MNGVLFPSPLPFTHIVIIRHVMQIFRAWRDARHIFISRSVTLMKIHRTFDINATLTNRALAPAVLVRRSQSTTRGLTSGRPGSGVPVAVYQIGGRLRCFAPRSVVDP